MRRHAKFFGFTFIFALLSVLSGIAVLNVIVDPAHVFASKAYEDGIARNLAAGMHTVGVDNYDDRLLQRYYLKHAGFKRDVIVLGSSRSYQWRARHFAGQFFNHSVNGNRLEDLLAIYGLYELQNTHPKTVVLGLDPWILNENVGSSPIESLEQSYSIMLRKLGAELNLMERRWMRNEKRLQTMFSLAYARRSIGMLLKNAPRVDGDYFASDGDNFDLPVKRADGSFRYSAAYRHLSVDEVRDAAVAAAREGNTWGSKGY